MALGRGRRDRGGMEAWPGYVDALSTLLMVIIFVLLVFVLAQGFLSVALSSRDRALERLNRQVAEATELLSLERGQAEELRGTLGRTAEELRAAVAARDALTRSLGLLREERDRLSTERDATRAERDRLAARIADLDLAARGGAGRIAELEGRLAEALARAEAAGGDAAQTVRTLTEAQRALAAERTALEAARRELAATGERLSAERTAREATARERDTARQALEARGREAEALARDLAAARGALEAARRDVAALREEAARLDRAVQADRATIEARLSDIARLGEQVRALQALRDEMERRAAAAMARAEAAEAARDQQAAGRAAAERAAADAQRAAQAAGVLAGEAASRAAEAERRRAAAEAQGGEYARLSESAQAQVALLTRQLEALRTELSRVAAALDAAEAATQERDVQIAALGQRLNAALAARVEELQQYRSDFFGRLRRVVGERPEVRIVGDRFVFQSEVLFPVGGAELSPAGQAQLRDLARVLIELSRQFPPDLAWLLRVDGHADRSPIRGGGRFASNWELSAGRAIAVAQLLIAEGLPANRVAATAFGDTQPLDDRDTPEAYARNRRIELRLTDR